MSESSTPVQRARSLPCSINRADRRNTNRLCAGLFLLAAENPNADIRLLINSPGGSVPGMLAIRDCMGAIPCDVVTVNTGMAYSAGQFLLSSGTRGKRYRVDSPGFILGATCKNTRYRAKNAPTRAAAPTTASTTRARSPTPAQPA